MSTRVRNAVTLLLLFLAAVASWYLASAPADSAGAGARRGGDSIGFEFTNAAILGRTQTGALHYRIVADRMEEVPDTDRLRLSGIEVLYEEADAIPWNVWATEAIADPDGSSLELLGRVVLESPAREDQEALRMETSYLRLDAADYLAQTEEAVTMRSGDRLIEGSGLRLHLRNDQFTLESSHARKSK